MLIRQPAFTGNTKMLKGGLHCHTTRSDGKGTPENVMRLHAQNGYDFLAITDHRRYNRISYAPDTKITIIPGMEFDSLLEQDKGFRCFHTLVLGPDDDSNPFTQDEIARNDVIKVRSQDDYQSYLDAFHQKNNLTVYCHPQWSATPARYFDRLQGDIAMEIWNSGCALVNEMDTNAAYWDELLGMGKRLFGVATDDGHAMNQHCHGWVMVNAENTVKAILRALSQGCFYSSCGPVITDFYVEDGVAHVTAEPCAQIQFFSDKHPTVLFRAEKEKALTEAIFDLHDDYRYIRASVVDEQGRRAWTNPIFLD